MTYDELMETIDREINRKGSFVNDLFLLTKPVSEGGQIPDEIYYEDNKSQK